jgi:hypothetical protein
MFTVIASISLANIDTGDAPVLLPPWAVEVARDDQQLVIAAYTSQRSNP